MIFRVVIILCNHYIILLRLFWAIKGFILYQIKQTALKSGYNFSTYDNFTDTRWNKELETRKPLSHIWASSSISRKRQTTGFEPLRHMCVIGSLKCIFTRDQPDITSDICSAEYHVLRTIQIVFANANIIRSNKQIKIVAKTFTQILSTEVFCAFVFLSFDSRMMFWPPERHEPDVKIRMS